MSTKVKARLKKVPMNPVDRAKRSASAGGHKRIEIRFPSPTEHALVEKAAGRSGLSINAWLVRTTLAAARVELG